MSDEWRPVPDLSYMASNLGEIRDIHGNLVPVRFHSHGYLQCWIRDKNLNPLKVYAHRIICSAFHGRCPGSGYEAHHINSKRSDNAAENLRWITISENRALRLVAKGELAPWSKLTDDQVRRIRDVDDIRLDVCFAKEFGCSRGAIYDARTHITWRHLP